MPNLQDAIDRNLLSLYRQPILSIHEKPTAPPEYFEILLRVNDRSPKDFLRELTSIEQQQLDRWVFENVLKLAPEYRYAVNVSARSAEDSEFVSWLCSIKSHWLIVEITEHHAYTERTPEVIRRLKSHFYMLMDDLGAGYSSLVNLHGSSFDGIKFGGRLVSEVCINEKSRQMTGGIMAMAQEMGLSCVTECVETLEIWETLIQLKEVYAPCLPLFVQGWAVGKPERA